ncbi:hypothetical protein AAG906_013684 [Vitis piasezkii]
MWWRYLDHAKPQNNFKGGMYTLNEDVDMQTKMIVLSRRLEELEARGAHETKRHPNQDENEQEEVCLIDTLIEEHVEGLRNEDLGKTYEEFEENEVEEANEIATINHSMQWKMKDKLLTPTNDEEAKKE